MAPLSRDQKRIIAQLARQAYDRWEGREAFEAINSDRSRTACFEAWRHCEQGKAIGLQSLCECTQAHYARLKAHFEALVGLDPTPTLVRDRDNPRRIALHKLTEALAAAGLATSYAAAICRRQYRCALDEASAKQLWNLFYTVRNRRKERAQPAQPPCDNPF